MTKRKPMPSPNASPNPSLSSFQASMLLELKRSGADQKTINDFLANPVVPDNDKPDADKGGQMVGDIVEDQLIAIVDSLGNLDARTYEMQQTLGRMTKDIDRLEQKLDQALELLKELTSDSGHHHRRGGGGGDDWIGGWND